MVRISIVFALALILPASAGENKFATVKVTGEIQLPEGAIYPKKTRVVIEIAKFQSGDVIAFYTVIGSQEIRTIKSTPLQFGVSAPKVHLKENTAGLFKLRARIYDLESGKQKLLFETPLAEALQPFTDAMQPKQNVMLPVKTPAEKRK
jgi:hypothetical protein